MRRELSTPYTFVYRWVIPGLLTLGSILIIWRFAKVGVPDKPETIHVLFGVAIAVSLMVIARYFDKAKRVWLDDDSLIVSAYGKEAHVDVSEIADVEATRYVRPDRVRIRFRRATRFGDRIVFFPPLRLADIPAPHPVADELTSLAENTPA